MLKDLLRYKVSAVRVGLWLMGGFLVFLGIAYMINSTFTLTFWDKGYELKADFTDAAGLANASDVRIAGVYVGQVVNVEPVAGKGLAEVTFRVDKAHSPVPQGSKIHLRLQTLLGTKFIEIEPGHPSNNATLPSESVVPADQTVSPVDFDQILQSFDDPTRKAVQQIVQELGQTTDGRGPEINTLLGDLHSLSVNSTANLETFNDRSKNLDAIVKNLADVTGNLSTERDHLAGVQTHLNDVLGTLAANDAGFRRFIEQGNIGLGHGLAQFQGEHQNINDIVRLARPAFDQLPGELQDVNALAHDFDSFMRISEIFTGDLFSSVTQYDHNANNPNCGSVGCGGFYLRQPTVLAQTPVDQETGGAGAASAQSAAPKQGSVTSTPSIPGLLPALLPGLLQGSPAGSGPSSIPGLSIPSLVTPVTPASQSDADSLLNWLLH
jgi:virulence factor Mce-like protein